MPFGDKPGDLYCETLTWEAPEFLKPNKYRTFPDNIRPASPKRKLDLSDLIKDFEEKEREYGIFLDELNTMRVNDDDELYQLSL